MVSQRHCITWRIPKISAERSLAHYNLLQFGPAGPAQYGRKFDQLRSCANDEIALAHSQDLL
jgi:hypothetical protein